jgi:hypothetical protein
MWGWPRPGRDGAPTADFVRRYAGTGGQHLGLTGAQRRTTMDLLIVSGSCAYSGTVHGAADAQEGSAGQACEHDGPPSNRRTTTPCQSRAPSTTRGKRRPIRRDKCSTTLGATVD